MGAAHSAHVAQTVTWALCEPLLGLPVVVHTMIDNVIIAADDAEAFALAVSAFVSRCDAVGVTLNDRSDIPASREGVIEWGRQTAEKFIFLGEEYCGPPTQRRICNTSKNVEKLRAAWQSLSAMTAAPRRTIASVIGACNWMAHTLNICVAEHDDALRVFSALASSPAGWDADVPVDASILDPLCRLVGPILANVPAAPLPTGPPFSDADSYDAVAITDACADGWAAIVRFPRSDLVFLLSAGWPQPVPHSAWAEPRAVAVMLSWLSERLGQDASVCVVTDHEPLVSGQRRWWSGFGGASGAFWLNSAWRVAYSRFSRVDFRHVAGDSNPADAPSRSVTLGSPLVATPYPHVFPALGGFPFPLAPRDRAWWNV